MDMDSVTVPVNVRALTANEERYHAKLAYMLGAKFVLETPVSQIFFQHIHEALRAGDLLVEFRIEEFSQYVHAHAFNMPIYPLTDAWHYATET